MLIQINADLRITSDPYNIIVQERKVAGEDAKNPGEERWSSVSFHPNVPQAANAILQRDINKSDATSLVELSAQIEATKNEILAAIERAGL